MAKTLAEMTAEIREVNIVKGWRNDEIADGSRTFGTYLALLHSEISEATQAYSKHLLADATEYDNGDPCADPVDHHHKPEGVGSELADVLIRLLDMCDVFGLTPFDMDMELADVAPEPLALRSFGDHMALLHKHAAQIELTRRPVDEGLARFLRTLITVAEVYGIDLDAEYTRKIAYNKTREFRHGGKSF